MKISIPKSLASASVLFSLSAIAFAGDTKDYKDPGYSFRSSPFRVSVDLRGGYDDNINTTKDNKLASWFNTVYADVTADLSNPRTQFSIGIGGGATYYYDVPNNEDIDYIGNFSLSLIHRFTPRLTVAATSLVSYQVQPNFAEQVGTERREGQYLYSNSSLSATYQWTQKFQTVTRYSFASVTYENGTVANVDDRFENYFSQEFRFLLTPVTTLSAQYRLGIVSYVDNTINDAITNYFLVGIDHIFSPKFNTAINVGVEVRDTDALGTKASPYGEASLSYIYSLYSSVELNARYGFENSNLSFSDERRTFRAGLQLNHGFTPKFALFGSVYYHNNQYDGFVDYEEDILAATIGLRYALSRNFTIETSYAHTDLWSDQEFREYDRNRYSLGGIFSF